MTTALSTTVTCTGVHMANHTVVIKHPWNHDSRSLLTSVMFSRGCGEKQETSDRVAAEHLSKVQEGEEPADDVMPGAALSYKPASTMSFSIRSLSREERSISGMVVLMASPRDLAAF